VILAVTPPTPTWAGGSANPSVYGTTGVKIRFASLNSNVKSVAVRYGIGATSVRWPSEVSTMPHTGTLSSLEVILQNLSPGNTYTFQLATYSSDGTEALSVLTRTLALPAGTFALFALLC
jgi:hypothetical protein